MKQFQIFDIIVEVGKCGSIRKAAERLFITPSALTRKIQDFESEFGRPIFERLPSGMRLNAAGDLLLKYIQMHRADYGTLLAEVSELDGVRRGHISIACAQAFIDNLLPDQISLYRAKFPGVTFTVDVRDNHLGISALENYQADLALLIDPPFNADIQEFFVRNQPICAVVSKAHPLAKFDSVSLKDCLDFRIAMPSKALVIRSILDKAIHDQNLNLNLMVESESLEFLRNYILREEGVTFQAQTGIPANDERLRVIPIRSKDLKPIRVVMLKLKGRDLSIAAESFAQQIGVHFK